MDYPFVEDFYDNGEITFWFKLNANMTHNFTVQDRNEISKATRVKFETRRARPGAYCVCGFVSSVYAAMERICAKLQLQMPQCLVDLKKEEEDPYDLPPPLWAIPPPTANVESATTSGINNSTPFAGSRTAQTPETVSMQTTTAAVVASQHTAVRPPSATQYPTGYPPRPCKPLPQFEAQDQAETSGRPTPAVTPIPSRTTPAVVFQQTTSTAGVAAHTSQAASAPEFRSATIRSLTGQIMGHASDNFVQQLMRDKEQWLERCPIQVVTLESGPRRALIECDRTVALIGHRYSTPALDYDHQKKLLGLCETLYCHFRACLEHEQLPEANHVVFVRNLRPRENHEQIFAMFYRAYDVIFKRRPPPDLSKELVAYVVFPTAIQARAAVSAEDCTNIKVKALENYGFFKQQYAWRNEFLRRLVTGQGCRPACMRSTNYVARQSFAYPPPPPVDQSVVADPEDDALTEASEDLFSTWSENESIDPLGDAKTTTAHASLSRGPTSSGRDRSARQLAPFPQETASQACRIEVPHRTLTWMLYSALDHRWNLSVVKSASEYEYVRWNDEQVIHVCDSICKQHPSFYNSVLGKLYRYDRTFGGNIADKFRCYRGRRMWENVDMFHSRKGNRILSMPQRYASHIHEVVHAPNLISVISDLTELCKTDFPVVTLDTEGCSSGERKGCRLLQLCTPMNAYLIDVWLVGDSYEFRDLMSVLFKENNGLCRYGFNFDATPKRLSGDRKELAVMFDTADPLDQAVRLQILQATVHDVRRLVAQTDGLNEEYVRQRPRLSHFCLYVLRHYMDKSEQKSCWGVDNLRPSQKKYAILDAVIPLLIVEKCRQLKPNVFETFRRMTCSATWNGEEDTDDDWWFDVPATASVSYRAANR